MATATPARSATLTQPRRPLFGGYALVAIVAAWLAGIALRAVDPLAVLTVLAWLLLAGVCAGLWLVAGLAYRQTASRAPAFWLRLALVSCMLGCWLALGAARAATADTSAAPSSVARFATGASVSLQGSVAAEPDLRDGYRFLTIDVSSVSANGSRTWQPASGRIEATVYGPDDWFAPAYGDAVSLTGKLQPPGSGYVVPGVVARMTSARATVQARGGGNPLLAALYALRVQLAQAIQRSLPEPEAALLIGILLGLKTPTLRARLPLFTSTGTIHLVVPAGLKVSTLAELASSSVMRLGRWPRTIVALLAVGLYAALGGGGPAAIRAAIMGALLALAPALGRTYNVFTALAVAVLAMTALDPLVIYDAGFQLTVLATAGLPLLVPPIQRRLALPLRRLPAGVVVAELLAVTLAAQIATLPVLLLTFHLISFVAPLANLLTVPLLAPLLVLGVLLAAAAALGGGVFGALALLLTWVTWPLLWFVDAAINWSAGLPAASFAVSAVPGIFAWAYFAVLVAAVALIPPLLRQWRSRGSSPSTSSTYPFATSTTRHGSGHVRLSRGLLAALLGVSLLGACGAAAPALADRAAHLDFLDVGPGGEAILLRLPTGVTALIDGGPSGPALEAALADRLPFWRRSLDLALLTDPRPGDARGLEDAATHFRIVRAADAGMAHPSTEDLAWLDATRRAGATHTTVRQGDAITLTPGTMLRVLSPPQQLFPPNQGDTTASDDAILRLDTPGLSALLLGSADDYALDALAYSGQPLAADIVELALPSQAPVDLGGPLGRVLALARPRLIVVCSAPVAPTSRAARAAADPAYVAADDDAALALGATILRTDAAGALSLSGGLDGWTLGG